MCLNNFYPIMTNVRACAGDKGYGTVNGCAIVSIDTSLEDINGNMYAVIIPPTHHGPRYLDVPFSDICFLSAVPPMIGTLTCQKH